MRALRANEPSLWNMSQAKVPSGVDAFACDWNLMCHIHGFVSFEVGKHTWEGIFISFGMCGVRWACRLEVFAIVGDAMLRNEAVDSRKCWRWLLKRRWHLNRVASSCYKQISLAEGSPPFRTPSSVIMSFLRNDICLGAALIFDKNEGNGKRKSFQHLIFQRIPRDHFYTHSGVSYPFQRLRHYVVKRGRAEKRKRKRKGNFWKLNWLRNLFLMMARWFMRGKESPFNSDHPEKRIQFL